MWFSILQWKLKIMAYPTSKIPKRWNPFSPSKVTFGLLQKKLSLFFKILYTLTHLILLIVTNHLNP